MRDTIEDISIGTLSATSTLFIMSDVMTELFVAFFIALFITPAVHFYKMFLSRKFPIKRRRTQKEQ